MEKCWKCPIAVLTYNRPEYLNRCLSKFSKSEDIERYSVPFFVFCDGGDAATIEENKNLISKYSFVTDTIIQSTNLGIASHVHFVRKILFDNMGFDRIIVFEDDILPSNFYWSYFNKCLDFAQSVDKNIVATNSCTLCYVPDHLKNTDRQWFIGDTKAHLNQYIMLKSAWKIIEPIVEEYIEKFVKPYGNYKNRNHDDIRRWLKRMKFPDNQKGYVGDLQNTATSQDQVTSLSLRSNGFYYVSTYVNRILNIGIKGEHFEKTEYLKLRLDEMSLYELPNDKNPIFELRELNTPLRTDTFED